MNANMLAELEAALPYLTPVELAEAEALLDADAQAALLDDMPDDILAALCSITDALQRSQGCPAANWSGADDVVFLDADGAVLPYDQWRLRKSGQLLTHEERLHIGPLAAWDQDGRFPVGEAEVEALLPDDMRRRLAEARRLGRWPRLSSSSTV
jgi:hypothetical protein